MRVHLVIRGRVQGVGFRFHAQRQALALGLVGWVSNAIDGSVVAVADGSEHQVQAFVGWCRRGPPSAGVTEVAVEAINDDASYADFSIKF